VSRTAVWLAGAVGLMDTFTGLGLIGWPAGTLALMGATVARDPTLVRYIGTFVLGVGLCYLVLAARSRQRVPWAGAAGIWVATALIRSLVAVFVTTALCVGALEPAWVAVTVTDGLVATVQWAALKKGYLP